MDRYIALLRGINISGKNKIAMLELKSEFMKLGYNSVFTHLNSGNIIFSSDKNDRNIIANEIKSMIQEQFGLDIPVFVILQKELQNIISNAPVWWGTDSKEIYHNLIFMIPNYRAEMIAKKIGEPTPLLEQIQIYDNVIFWSFDKVKYAKCNWWKKTATIGISEAMTIRTANTLRKIATM